MSHNNKLLFNLLNQKQQEVIIEVNEKTIEEYESEVFKLNEKICHLENKLLASNSDEGLHSQSTSTNSLHSGNPLSSKKTTKTKSY